MLKLPDHPGVGKVLGAAGHWAERFGSSHLGTEHVLLALAEVNGPTRDVLADAGVSVEVLREAILQALPESQRKLFAPSNAEVLEDLGIDLEALRKELAKEFGARLPLGRPLTVTTALTATFWLSDQQAERLGSAEATPEHLLLALLWQARDFAGSSALSSKVSASQLRRRLLERMGVPPDIRTRYLDECERSDAIAVERQAAARRVVDWIDPLAREAPATELLVNGGQAAVAGSEALDRLLERASLAGFSVINAALREAPAFWVEVNSRIRQVFVATAFPGPSDEIENVGVSNPGLVPGWVDVRSWPGFPVEQHGRR